MAHDREASAMGVRNHIRTLRFMAGEMTQQELANRIGVSRQTLNAIEGGKYSPSLEVAFKIARAFGKPLDAVFEYVIAGEAGTGGIQAGSSSSVADIIPRD